MWDIKTVKVSAKLIMFQASELKYTWGAVIKVYCFPCQVKETWSGVFNLLG